VTARLALVVLALLAGCSRAPKPARPAPAPTFRLDVEARADANRGGPVYVVIRRIDRARFLADEYDSIARGLFAREPDPGVLAKRSVGPGQKARIEVPREVGRGEVLAVYALFSAPGPGWRLAVLDAEVRSMAIVLGRDHIVSARSRR
jgi:predicted component of type VI protein secretion system